VTKTPYPKTFPAAAKKKIFLFPLASLRLNLSFKVEIMRTGLKSKNRTLAGTALLWAVSFTATLSGGERERVELTPFTVFGSAENVYFAPGSGYFLSGESLRVRQIDNIEQALRRVPGVYFRTEDGFGIFPNISFRGVGSMRTTKLTVMEDGVLAAPAPYANPAAYYTPTTGRMSAMEILKGSSQIAFGPHTTGGVLNFLSTPIPQEAGGRVNLTVGDNGEFRILANYGESFALGEGAAGLLVEGFFRRNEGFKRIDTSPTFAGGDTGFHKFEPMVKAFWAPATALPQRFEVKVGYTDMNADETYLGLATQDHRADARRRYVSTQFDRIETEHWRTFLRHTIEFSADARLDTTIYYNQFTRSWYKLHDVRGIEGGATSLAEALAGSAFYGSGDQPLPGTEGLPLAVLRGEAAGIWRVRDNNRAYKSYGAETIFQQDWQTASLNHRFIVGVRLHEDYEDRFQKQDDFTTDASGNVVGSVLRRPGTQDNRRGTARALAVHARDRIEWDALTIVPGVRYERVRYTDDRRGMNPDAPDFNQIIRSNTATLDVWAPGIGFTYDLAPNTLLLGGVHRGFSLPGPGNVINNDFGPETSVGYELGLRHTDNGGLQAEATLFWTDFSNLIVPDSIGGAGTGQAENAGSVRTRGVEVSLAYDAGRRLNWGFSNTYEIAVTLTDATLRSDLTAGGTGGAAIESIFAGGQRGNRLPYVPRYQIALGTGLQGEAFGIFLDAFYVPSTYASANNSREEINPVGRLGADGTLGPAPDSRFGKNDAYFLLDLTATYDLTERWRLTAGAQNLLDRTYIASRLPHGPRPGHPRFLFAGIQASF
jgi:Fe(3+) dicitrate transport protein